MERWKKRSARSGMWFIHQPWASMAMMTSPSPQCSQRETLPQLEFVFLIMAAGLGAILKWPALIAAMDLACDLNRSKFCHAADRTAAGCTAARFKAPVSQPRIG